MTPAGGSTTSNGWEFSGTASGGSIEFTVGAVFVSVVTSPGQTPAQVAAAVAAAINADATLSAAGITATVNGDRVKTHNGVVTRTQDSDAGITYAALYPAAPSVPALGGYGVGLVLLALLGAGVAAARRAVRA